MTKETFTLARTGNKTLDGLVEYSSPGIGVTLWLHRVQPPDYVSVVIEPAQTREERLREARLEALNKAFTGLRVYPRETLEIIERVDAEFAKGEK